MLTNGLLRMASQGFKTLLRMTRQRCCYDLWLLSLLHRGKRKPRELVSESLIVMPEDPLDDLVR